MPRTTPPQREAGAFLRASREAAGYDPGPFCAAVERAGATLDESTLWRIENRGTVPVGSRRRAIASVLDMRPGDIWDTPNHRLVSRLVDQINATQGKAAA